MVRRVTTLNLDERWIAALKARGMNISEFVNRVLEKHVEKLSKRPIPSISGILEPLLIRTTASLKEAMAQIDRSGLGTVVVVDENQKLLGLLTDGDIRRSIMNGSDISTTQVGKIMNRKPLTLTADASNEEILNTMKNKNVAGKIPLVDKTGKVVNLAMLSRDGRLIKFAKESRAQVAVKRVLVTGGAGYLGSVLVRKLLARGYFVRVLDNLVQGDDGIKGICHNEKVELLKGDVRNLHDVINGLSGIDAVIHLAAIVGDPACKEDPSRTLENNLHATKMLADVCKYHQVNRLIFASTCSVYGASDEEITEDSPLNPVSLYARSKIDSERGLLNALDENFAPTILRLATLYGLSDRMRFDLVINLFAAQAFVDKKITVFGGHQWRPFVHVRDAAEAFIKVLESPIETVKGEVFNVGSNNQNYTISSIAGVVKEVFPDIEVVTNSQSTDKRNYKVCFGKFQKATGFKPEMTIKAGLSEIKTAFELGKFEDYKNQKYHNVKLQDEIPK